jgi:CRISPR-associated protein Csd1
MILQSLRDLAVRERLVDDPAFESKPVRWIVKVTPDGGFVGVYDTNTTPIQIEGKKGKPRPLARMMVIPRRLGRTGNISADFLVDKAEYALGLVPEGELATKKTEARHEDFKALLRTTQVSTGNAALQGVLAFLEQTPAMEACAKSLAEQGGFATNDLFCFDMDVQFVQDEEELRAWWASRTGDVPEGAASSQCLMCGLLKPYAAKHNSLQIAGGVSSGVPLVSFNSDAFESYGWTGNKNASICNECMTAYVEGLRRLTRSRYVLPLTGETVGPLSTRLNGDTTAVYWADEDSDTVAALPFLREQPQKVRELLASPHKGSPRSTGASERFFCLILTGAQGRAIVRRVHTGTVAALERNLRRFFRSTDVDRFDRSAPMPIFRLLQTMVLQGKLDRLPPELGTELWLASLFAQPLSRLFLAALVARNRAERAVPPERAALLQFYFSLRTAQTETKKEGEERMSLDRESKDPPYLLGRLLAVLESAQTAAQGQNLNRTIVDRFYGSASTRPAVVFPQLLQLAIHHLAKAGKKAEGKARFLDAQLGSILDGLKVGGFSATLNLEQQGDFALGYYHQRQSFYKRKDAEAAPQLNEVVTEMNGDTTA